MGIEYHFLVYQCKGDSTVVLLLETKNYFDSLFTSRIAGFLEETLPAVNSLLSHDWIDTEKLRFPSIK